MGAVPKMIVEDTLKSSGNHHFRPGRAQRNGTAASSSGTTKGKYDDRHQGTAGFCQLTLRLMNSMSGGGAYSASRQHRKLHSTRIARRIFGGLPESSADPTISSPANRIGFLELSGFKPMFVLLPIRLSPYAVRTSGASDLWSFPPTSQLSTLIDGHISSIFP